MDFYDTVECALGGILLIGFFNFLTNVAIAIWQYYVAKDIQKIKINTRRKDK